MKVLPIWILWFSSINKTWGFALNNPKADRLFFFCSNACSSKEPPALSKHLLLHFRLTSVNKLPPFPMLRMCRYSGSGSFNMERKPEQLCRCIKIMASPGSDTMQMVWNTLQLEWRGDRSELEISESARLIACQFPVSQVLEEPHPLVGKPYRHNPKRVWGISGAQPH